MDAHLSCGRVSQLAAAVPYVHVGQTREAIDVPIAFRIE